MALMLAMDSKDHFEIKGKVLCIITGGSRGFGRALALAFSEVLEDGSCISIIAKTEKPLQEVKASILQKNQSLTVFTTSEDLSKMSYESATQLLRKMKKEDKFDRAILVHNVGTLGDVSQTADKLKDSVAIQQYLDLNVTSVFTFTSAFLQEFQDLISKHHSTLILNITSLAAIQPFPGWAQYCTGKAAREMYFKVLAEEFPTTSILSYSPGPMETDMTTEILQSALPAIQDWFKNARTEGKLLSCEKSVKKLLLFLKQGSFKSGVRVDYYDIDDS